MATLRSIKTIKPINALILAFSVFYMSVGHADYESCNESSVKSGEVYAVKGHRVYMRAGPGIDFPRLQKKTDQDKKSYVRVSYGHIVKEMCRQGEWSQVALLAPEKLRSTHRGWVKSQYLKN